SGIPPAKWPVPKAAATFGYTSREVAGTEGSRRGRSSKPRRAYVIDDDEALWVMQIFDWWVRDEWPISRIIRELTKRSAPKDHRSTTSSWSRGPVLNVLQNTKYIGIWPWGENENVRDPETGTIRQEPRSDEECGQWTRHLPHLALIDEETFRLAQQRIEVNAEKCAAHRSANGRLNGSRQGDASPRHLLSGLIQCEECGRTFHVGGTHGRYLFCPGSRQGSCSCSTQLRRDRAERMILDEIGRRMIDDPAWLDAVWDSCRQAWRQAAEQIPQEIAAVERVLDERRKAVERLVDLAEQGTAVPELSDRLHQRRQEVQELVQRIDQLRRSQGNPGPEPTLDNVREQLAKLGQLLASDAPAAAGALRKLVGGQIVVREIRREGRSRHYLQGHFSIRTSRVADALLPGDRRDPVTKEDEPEEQIVIDFVEPDPLAAESDQAKAMYDEGLLSVEIAERMKCSKSKVTKLIKRWFESRGLPVPDGRSRRGTLDRGQRIDPLYQQLADQVKACAEEGLLFAEIAGQLGCDRNTVTSAWVYWHESRSLPIPDGRSRRKNLSRKSRSPSALPDP
ncbi:MAG: recombinase family protein, partial [Planctomycetaceae bacterium]|nr:recombinase family protein [Planctomycetaceae bacterium]